MISPSSKLFLPSPHRICSSRNAPLYLLLIRNCRNSRAWIVMLVDKDGSTDSYSPPAPGCSPFLSSPSSKPRQLLGPLFLPYKKSLKYMGSHFYSKNIQTWLNSVVLLLTKTGIRAGTVHLPHCPAWWFRYPLSSFSFPVLARRVEEVQGRNSMHVVTEHLPHDK